MTGGVRRMTGGVRRMTGGARSMTCGTPSMVGWRALQRASQPLNVVRHLWRLSHELKAVLPRAHAHGAERLVQLGRQLGGSAIRWPHQTRPFAIAWCITP